MGEVKWIRIATEVFDNRKIKQIETMPDGDSVIVIWFKLLCLAGNINDNGMIYFTKEIPYTEEMLATQFNRPLLTVKLALDTFRKFNMVDIVEDILHISSWERYQNVEGLDRIREETRLRVQKHRENKKLLSNVTSNVTRNVTVTQCNAIDIDKDKDIYIDKEKILIAWNDLPSPIKNIRDITKKRRDKIKARMNSLKVTNEDIIQAINNIKGSNFLQGKNNRNWIIDFDWLFQDDTRFLKVLEGKYGGGNNAESRKDDTEHIEYDFTEYE